MALPPSDQPGIVRIEQPGTDLETYVTLRAYRRVWYDRGWRSPLDDPEWAGSGDPSPAAAWIRSTEKGAAGGVATLDEAGQVPAEQLANATSELLPAAQPINAQTGTSYTAVLSDAGKLVTCDNASPFTFTVPPASSVAYDTGAFIDVAQLGAGAVTVAEGSGVTIVFPVSLSLVLQEEGSVVTLRYLGSDTWLAAGDLTAA